MAKQPGRGRNSVIGHQRRRTVVQPRVPSGPIVAYKFRSPAQIAFALDILFNNRLHCAEWSKLNDPMEGCFGYSLLKTDETDYSALLDDIRVEKKRLRICALSMTFDCHLLWAHYADGFAGVALEVELPSTASELTKVEYCGVFAHLNIANESDAEQAARRVLQSKNSEWAYEKEVRIISDQEWYPLATPVRRLICGHRMNPSLFEALRIVCAHKGVTINRTGIGDEGIDADSVPALGESW